MTNPDDEIIDAWRSLVIKSGATPPKSFMRPNEIYKLWCPPSTHDVKHIEENRPDLKKILKQSLSGKLRREGYPEKIVNNDEFSALWELIHGDFNPVLEEDLKLFAKYRIKGVRAEMWKGVSEDDMTRLIISFMKFKGVETFVDQYHRKWVNWIDEQKVAIDQLEEFAKENPNYAPKGHPVYDDIEEGREILTKARKERASMPKFVAEVKKHLLQDIFDALRGKLKISEKPNWVAKLDGDFMVKSQAVYELIFSGENDDPARVVDMALSDFKEADENHKVWVDRMVEAHARLVKAGRFS